MAVINEWRARALMGLCVAVLAACSSPRTKAPVEERVATAPVPAPATTEAPAPPAPVPAVAAAASAASAPLPGAENAGKPGYYTLKPGDTVRKVAEANGQNWRDIVRWNNLDNPNALEVGQVLRIVAPPAEAAAVATRPVAGAGRVESKPLEVKPAPPPMAATPAPAPAPAAASDVSADGDDVVVWGWPANGPVLAGFDEGRNKGLTIGGVAGDPVLAAGDGRVVYAGSSLRGYGNLVIVKHNENYLTAYAHNQTLLVKDDQAVRRGQRIADMGSTDAQRVQLHFEIRRQGKPIDPAKLLPPR